jgi:6-pyruvoyl-tetrahydropterin synthase
VFAVEVRHHVMVAHSFRGEVFGPAQRLHGATFVVDAAFMAERLDANGIVVDIGRAHDALKAALAPLDYRNLDELPEFAGVNTTTEFVARYVFDRLAIAARAGELGRDGRELAAIRITISESHLARAWYEAALW